MPSIKLSQEDISFYRPLIATYLKTGSVDKVFAGFDQNPGVSYPHFHRILQKWGIIKSAGGNSHLTEAVYFFSALAKNKLPLETVYKTMPPSLQVSAVTLHRILSYIKRGVVRRKATALIITSNNNPNDILIGKDVSTPRPDIGKPYGSLSLPMTFSKRTETSQASILRVLQQEVFTNLALTGEMPNIIPPFHVPIMSIDIADVRIYVYSLTIPASLKSKIKSFKLTDYQFIPLVKVAQNISLDSPYRAGVPEIATSLLERNLSSNMDPLHISSDLNHQLATLPTYE